jgi:aspartate aminotransferase/aminotransferase
MMTDGVSGGLLLAFMSMINPGDEVIMTDPYFVIYKHVINLLQGKCVLVDTYPDFRLPPEKFAAAITDRTKLIILNSPANPTGTVYSAEELKKISDIARQKDIPVLSDEIYDVFTYSGKCPSIASFYEKTLVLNGFSKTSGMTGWRIGYAACSQALAPLMEKMMMIQQYTFVCAPTPFQMSVPAALKQNMSDYVEKYRAKRDCICEGLREEYQITKPDGAFYMFIKIPPKYPNATDFVKKAIENNVLVIPGNVFSEQDTHFRLSYATTDDKIEQGIEILNHLAQ